jgi:hypothetical protein
MFQHVLLAGGGDVFRGGQLDLHTERRLFRRRALQLTAALSGGAAATSPPGGTGSSWPKQLEEVRMVKDSFTLVLVLLVLPIIAPMHAAAQPLIVRDQRTAVLTGPLGHGIQSVRDILTSRKSIVVLEGETNSLIALTDDLKTISRTDNTGPGGARLAHPLQMTSSQAGDQILVIDAQTSRLAKFAWRDERLALVSVTTLKQLARPAGICQLGNTTLVLGSEDTVVKSRLLHSVDVVGKVVSSFGEGFGPATEPARMLYGQAKLLCLQKQQLAVVASLRSPEVRAYDARGNLRWKQLLPEHRTVTYTEQTPGSIRWVYPPDNMWDLTMSTFQPTDDVVAVQIGRKMFGDSKTRYHSLRTVLLGAVDGRPLGTQSDLPLIVGNGLGRLLTVDEGGSLTSLGVTLQGQ